MMVHERSIGRDSVRRSFLGACGYRCKSSPRAPEVSTRLGARGRPAVAARSGQGFGELCVHLRQAPGKAIPPLYQRSVLSLAVPHSVLVELDFDRLDPRCEIRRLPCRQLPRCVEVRRKVQFAMYLLCSLVHQPPRVDAALNGAEVARVRRDQVSRVSLGVHLCSFAAEPDRFRSKSDPQIPHQGSVDSAFCQICSLFFRSIRRSVHLSYGRPQAG